MMEWRFVALHHESGAAAIVLVGHVFETGMHRITSPVVAVDGEKRTAITRSGRLYELLGPSGRHKGAELLLRLDPAASCLTAQDVTDEVCARFGLQTAAVH